jgi:hypothetical protein
MKRARSATAAAAGPKCGGISYILRCIFLKRDSCDGRSSAGNSEMPHT